VSLPCWVGQALEAHQRSGDVARSKRAALRRTTSHTDGDRVPHVSRPARATREVCSMLSATSLSPSSDHAVVIVGVPRTKEFLQRLLINLCRSMTVVLESVIDLLVLGLLQLVNPLVNAGTGHDAHEVGFLLLSDSDDAAECLFLLHRIPPGVDDYHAVRRSQVQ